MNNLSRIYIGKSDKNIQEYNLNTKYKIKDVIINPFGSTKMRFHYPLSFELNFDKNINIENTINIYIKKKINRDYSNSIYLAANGWTNDLSITCLLNNFIIDNECIETFIPKNYGNVIIENIGKNKTKKFKVGIVIPTFGRFEYTKLCFESLIKCNLDDCILIIVDESMTKNINDDKINSNEYIKNFNFNIPTIKIFKNKHGNMYDSINIGLDILGHFCEYLMTMDSDTIHKKDFMKTIINTYDEINKNNKNKIICLSGFNTDKHKFIENNKNDNYYIKDTLGGCHLCFSTNDYWNYIRYTLISYKWDTNITNLVNKEKGILAATKPSVIEHIGEISSVRNDNLKHDKSIDFIHSNLSEKKYFIISEDYNFENNQQWIIDVFKSEFIKYSNLHFVSKPEDADIIWIIGFNLSKIKYLKTINLTNKKIITTIHHIDFKKIKEFKENFNELHNITNVFHVICNKVHNDLSKFTTKKIVTANFWINENIFKNINNIDVLKKKYNIPLNSFCVGSFQRDTLGKKLCIKPKLSKGPDIFIKIVEDMKKTNSNLLIILTGRRRNYIINELIKKSINYKYYEMITPIELNELYNCLDIYIVSSRVEGGPRAIIEAGLSKTPLISTNVGISDLILNNDSIYDMNDPYSYTKARPNIEYAYTKSSNYSITNYLGNFINILFES